ncbi:MAG: TetR/AcrR family transcriptional regulator [Phycisphaeraceae bacterium]|nr:TetR/AcrR family transcriptional regulator [Phycisphaeraceae bacterium]MBX3367642.1 TetR/AcrR family transcriptional regulator [Phycisphaeraceae bacterium]
MTQVPTRERLLDSAGDLFYKHGFQAVGLDQILETVGITKTAFYKHFASKDDLIVAILDQRDQREMEEWMAYIRIRGRDDARRQLEALFELLDDWFQKPEFRGCLFLNALTEFPSENDPINRAARKHGEHLAAAVMELAKLAGAAEPGALTEQIMLLVTGAIASRHRACDFGAAKTAEAMAKVLITSQCGRAARRA